MKSEHDEIVGDAKKLRKRGLALLDARAASFAASFAPAEEKKLLDLECKLAERKYRLSVAANKVMQDIGLADA